MAVSGTGGHLFPIGHYLGRAAAGQPRRLRLGARLAPLHTDAEFGIWALAHSRPGRDAERAWGRAEVVDQAERLGIDQPEQIIDALLARQLLAEVRAGGAVRFARAHRLLPLRSGLGQVPDDPLGTDPDEVGLPTSVPISPRQFRLWQWSRLAANLWELSQALTADPADLLADLLPELHALLAVNAAYLDRTRNPRSLT
jgi:hypothetical protein